MGTKKAKKADGTKRYKVLKDHRVNEPGFYMYLKSGITFFPPKEMSAKIVRDLVDDKVIVAIGASDEGAPSSPLEDDSIEGFPCPNPECPIGRNEGGEAGPYTNERYLKKHLKASPDLFRTSMRL